MNLFFKIIFTLAVISMFAFIQIGLFSGKPAMEMAAHAIILAFSYAIGHWLYLIWRR